MDWSAIQAVTMMMPADCTHAPRLEEALEFLKVKTGDGTPLIQEAQSSVVCSQNGRIADKAVCFD